MPLVPPITTAVLFVRSRSGWPINSSSLVPVLFGLNYKVRSLSAFSCRTGVPPIVHRPLRDGRERPPSFGFVFWQKNIEAPERVRHLENMSASNGGTGLKAITRIFHGLSM